MILTSSFEFFLPVRTRFLFNSDERKHVCGGQPVWLAASSPECLPSQPLICRLRGGQGRCWQLCNHSAPSAVMMFQEHERIRCLKFRGSRGPPFHCADAQIILVRGWSLLFHGPLCTAGAGRAIRPPLWEFPQIVFRGGVSHFPGFSLPLPL